MKTKNLKNKNINFKIMSKKATLFLIVILVGCSKPDAFNENKVAYYNFKETDKEKLLLYTENQQLNFRNQFGEERVFEVTSVSKNFRQSYTVGMCFFTSYAAKYFDYDRKEINFSGSMCGQFNIVFTRWPLNTDLAKSNLNVEYPSSFNGFISYFPYWNGLDNQNNSSSHINIVFGLYRRSLTINNKIYDNVIRIESNNTNAIPTSNQNCPKNVNIIYYDLKSGIIGFDDLDNKNWRLQ